MDTLNFVDIAAIKYYSGKQLATDITYCLFGLYHLGKYAYRRILYGSSKEYKIFNHCSHLGTRPLYKEQGGVCAKCTRMCCAKCIEYISDEINKTNNCHLGICNQCIDTYIPEQQTLLRR